jgi:hypothetical protein
MTKTARRYAALAGMIGPLLFAATFTLEGWLRPGYHACGMYVSALSLGPRGWIQILNFIVFGALLLAFARGVAAEFRDGPASRAGPALLTIIAISLVASGPFVMDPMNTPRAQMSVHGMVHQIFGAIVFTLMPVTCFVFARRFRADSPWRAFGVSTLTAGVTIVVAIVLLKIAQLGLPPRTPNALTAWVGLLQRAALVTFLAWLFAFAFGVHRRITRSDDGAK